MTIETKHTPGPWSANKMHARGGIEFYIDDVATIDGPNYDFPEMEANARLIAAAPEMLELLKLSLNRYKLPRAIEHKARAIIANIEGK